MQGGGAERVMALLCNEFATHGHDTTLVTFVAPDQSPFYGVSESVRLIQLGQPSQARSALRVVRLARLLPALRRTMTGLKPDVVVSFIDDANIITLVATRGLNVPVLVCERTDPNQHRSSWLTHHLRNIMYPRASRIVVQTKRAAGFFTGTPAGKIAVIPNPVPAARVLAHPEIPALDGRYRIIAVGRLDRNKGFHLLIESFAALAGRFPQWDVAIFGDGPAHDVLAAQIVRVRLGERIKLMGLTKDVEAELARSHIMAFPSGYEGFPNALAEAMAAGLPAVAFRGVSGVEDLIEPGISGLLIDRGTDSPASAVRVLGSALETLMSSSQLRSSLGAGARVRVAAFRPDIVMQRWDDLVSEVARQLKR